jgi:hypothetical protein
LKTADLAFSGADGRDPATLGSTAKVAFWGLVFWGGEQLAAGAFERNELAMAAVQAALAEWGASRMAIAWSDPRASTPTWKSISMRIARGAAFGAGAAAVVAVAAIVARSATVAPRGLAVAPLLVGLVIAAMGAVRDELLLRGVVLGATRLLPLSVALLTCGMAAAAARLGTEGVFTNALAPEALRGVALGALWVRDRGAWMACAANTAWTWMTGSVFGAGWLDLRYSSRPGGESMTELAVLAVVATVAFLWTIGDAHAVRRAS